MDNNINLMENERIDDLHRNNLVLIQNSTKFCFGIDAVLLSDFTKVKLDESALDLGTGTGVIPILLTAKNEHPHRKGCGVGLEPVAEPQGINPGKTNIKKYVGLEIQESLVEMARRSVKLNHLEDLVSIDLGDIKNLQNIYKPSSFDVVTTNPPYMNHGGGILNQIDTMTISRHEILCNLEHIISGASKILKPNGRFYMVHRPHRLTDIFFHLHQNKLEPKKMRFVHSYAHKEPTLVLIEAIRNARPMLKVLPPLVIYDDNGKYMDEIVKIYYE